MKLSQKPTSAELREFLSGDPRRIHLIGVAGSGMSGIAGLLLALGHKVSGCDRATTAETHRLKTVGLDFHCPHTPEPMQDAELVIYSSAIKPGNLSYDEAVRLNLPMVRRAQALAGLMTLKDGVVVCGMHGKTTTSSMAAYVLRAGRLQPSHYIGAEVPILGANAHWNNDGKLFVAEGDESDGTLALYAPAHAIVLNIEEEHMDFYRDLDHIRDVFGRVLDQTRGKIVYNIGDPETRRLCESREGAVSFGLSEEADYQAHDIVRGQQLSYFKVRARGEDLGRVTLRLPGEHNILNALSVIALATELGVDFPAIHEAMDCFRGARRRFESIFQGQHYRIVDDYGHHPTEILTTLEAARNTEPQRLVVMFQPHRYSRTQLLFDKFLEAFDMADTVFFADIYPASEDPIEGVTAEKLVEGIEARDDDDAPRAYYGGQVEDLPRKVAPYLRPGDLLLSLGAGNVHEAARVIAPKLSQAEAMLDVMDGEGRVRVMEPLSDHTTLKVGGPADYWVEPESIKAFSRLIKYCRQAMIPLMVMGRGSNLLVKDGGIRGVVVHLHRGEFREITVAGNTITSGAGVKYKAVAAKAKAAGLGGFEWMEGIPGAVGGALRMNAGAMGLETYEQVEKVWLVDETGEVLEKTPEQLEIRYRSVPALTRMYAAKAVFRGEPRDEEEIERLMNESMEKRRGTQPVAACAGCTFKNPESIPAGKLIDELGLKNTRIGDARVSEVHGNFIVNEGNARARDVLDLIAKIQEKARTERGIELETEVEIVGQDELDFSS